MPTEQQIERAARIIDPQSWALFDHGLTNEVWDDAPRQVSLQKARQVLELKPDDRQS